MERASLPSSYFNAPWGVLLSVMTLFGAVILLGLPAYTLYTDKVPSGGPSWLFYGLPFMLLLAYFFTVRGYEIGGDELRIMRPGWQKIFSLRNLQSVDFVPRAMRYSIRTFGNGGLFSFVGNYRNDLLGPYKAYATHFHKTVVLKFPERTIVVTPDEPEKFRDILLQFVHQNNEPDIYHTHGEK